LSFRGRESVPHSLYTPETCLNHIASRFLVAARFLRAFCRLSILHRLRDSPNTRCSCAMAGTALSLLRHTT